MKVFITQSSPASHYFSVLDPKFSSATCLFYRRCINLYVFYGDVPCRWIVFEIFTATKIQVVVFWVMTPCSDVVGYQRFGAPCWLRL